MKNKSLKQFLPFSFILLVLILSSCGKEEIRVASGQGMAPVTIKVTDFSISTDAFDTIISQGIASTGMFADAERLSADNMSFKRKPSKGTVASYTGVKAITLAFFDAQGNQAYCTTQLRNDNTTYTTFGEFELSLNLGSYTMVVLGYGSEVPMTVSSATEAVFTADRCRETFVASQAVNVTSTSALTLNAELSRVVSKVHVKSSDQRVSGVDSVRVTFSAGGKGVNPQTGLASTNSGLTNTVATSTAVGVASNTVSYLFLNADEQTMTVTIETIKADGTVYSTQVVENVPLQRNKVTVLTGPLYSNASGAAFTLSTGWMSDTNYVNF